MREQKERLKERGIIFIGFWEPIYFLKQLGRAGQNTASKLDFLRSEDYVRHVAELGVNQIWCNFSKGYGLACEEAEQRKIRALCEHAHKHGMQVVAYCTGGSLTPETLKLDYPDNPSIVDDMLARRDDGKWASYGNNSYQNWRVRPDYTSPDYMAWQKRVIKKALDFGCDGIHFDNTNVLPEPAACRCPRCERLFREFLKHEYCGDRSTAGLGRWGRTEMEHTTVPWYDEWNDPVLHREVTGANTQAWLLFRQKTFNECLAEWADYIHELGGLCEYNIGKSPGLNYRAYGAINDEVLLEKADIVFNEGPYATGYNGRNTPVTRIGAHKIAQAFDIPMMNYNLSTHMMAEAFSFNPGMLGRWDSAARPQDHPEVIRFFEFYRKYDQYQTRQRSLAETAILMHHESLTFSILKAYMSFTAITQLLQEERIPFNLVYKKDLDDLAQYKLVVVADAYCLKQWEVEKLGAYVNAGGRLLSIGRTGERDDHFQVRTRIKEVTCLEELYGAEETDNAFTPLTGEDFTSDFIKPVGGGMVAHVGRLEFPEEPRYADRGEFMIQRDLLGRPTNDAYVMSYLDHLLPDRGIRVESSADLLVDLCRRTDTGEGIVHLFNVSWAKSDEAQANVEFVWDEEVTTLTRIGYDRDESSLPYDVDEGTVRFQLDGIKESAVVIVNKR